MRIVSGKYKGRILKSPLDNAVRPTTDKVKEAIFNTMQFIVPNSVFLDLFSGSGAIGIEAISRGAREVVFVDISKDSLKVIKENLLKIDEKARIIKSDYKSAITLLGNYKFDIIYLDPPYYYDKLNEILICIKEKEILSEDGIIIYEHLAKGAPVDTDLAKLIKTKKYGTIQVDMLKF